MSTKLHAQSHSWYHCSSSGALPAETCLECHQREGKSRSQPWYSRIPNLPFPTPLLCFSQCFIQARFAGLYIIYHESNQCHFLSPMEQLLKYFWYWKDWTGLFPCTTNAKCRTMQKTIWNGFQKALTEHLATCAEGKKNRSCFICNFEKIDVIEQRCQEKGNEKAENNFSNRLSNI